MDEKKEEAYTRLLIAANFLGPLVSGLLTYYMVKKNIGPEEIYKMCRDAYESAKRSLRELEYGRYGRTNSKDL